MAGFIKFDGIANQKPQNITRAAAPRREAEASQVSPRDTKDTFTQSTRPDKASPKLTSSTIDKASPGLRNSLDTSTHKLEGKLDILG